jgi:hypothetical protein
LTASSWYEHSSDDARVSSEEYEKLLRGEISSQQYVQAVERRLERVEQTLREAASHRPVSTVPHG